MKQHFIMKIFTEKISLNVRKSVLKCQFFQWSLVRREWSFECEYYQRMTLYKVVINAKQSLKC